MADPGEIKVKFDYIFDLTSSKDVYNKETPNGLVKNISLMSVHLQILYN